MVSCPRCGGLNPVASLFCSGCGSRLVADLPHSEAGAVTSEAAASEAASSSPSLDEAPSLDGEPLPADEIDARHARVLLDRAVGLSRRGDAEAAILACRQSIALAPTSASGYSVLGRLLRNVGDIEHAIAAHRKALELHPDSKVDRLVLQELLSLASASATGDDTANAVAPPDVEFVEGQAPPREPVRPVAAPRATPVEAPSPVAPQRAASQPTVSPAPNISAVGITVLIGFVVFAAIILLFHHANRQPGAADSTAAPDTGVVAAATSGLELAAPLPTAAPTLGQSAPRAAPAPGGAAPANPAQAQRDGVASPATVAPVAPARSGPPLVNNSGGLESSSGASSANAALSVGNAVPTPVDVTHEYGRAPVAAASRSSGY